MNIHEMTKDQLKEESLINIAFEVLGETRQPLTLIQLMDAIRKLNGITEKQMKQKMQQFYTDMNIDGRFLAINDNRWGLREWYPVDQIEVETAPVVKVRKKKKKKKKKVELEEEEIEDEDEDEDELFDEDFDELIDDEDDEDDDDDDDEEEVVEIEADLLEPDDELEIIPDDEELEINEEEDEEEDEEEE